MFTAFALAAGLLVGWGIYEIIDDDDDNSSNDDMEPAGEAEGQMIDGDGGNDILRGTPGDDVIRAGGGNDQVEGLSGNDLLFGEQGNDSIQGDAGTDVIKGGAGRDVLEGGSDADIVLGQGWRDDIRGDTGNDILSGGADDDTVRGGSDEDVLFGGNGDDLIAGESGDDLLYGGFGADTLNGGSNSDTLIGVNIPGFDEVIEALEDAAEDFESPEDAQNFLDDALAGASSSLSTFIDSDAGDRLSGGAGDDTIIAGAGDTVLGGSGADEINIWTAIEDDEGVATPVTIADFNEAEDALMFTVQTSRFDLGDETPEEFFEVTTQTAENGEDAEVLLNGVVYATVANQAVLDPGLVSLVFFD